MKTYSVTPGIQLFSRLGCSARLLSFGCVKASSGALILDKMRAAQGHIARPRYKLSLINYPTQSELSIMIGLMVGFAPTPPRAQVNLSLKYISSIHRLCTPIYSALRPSMRLS